MTKRTRINENIILIGKGTSIKFQCHHCPHSTTHTIAESKDLSVADVVLITITERPSEKIVRITLNRYFESSDDLFKLLLALPQPDDIINVVDALPNTVYIIACQCGLEKVKDRPDIFNFFNGKEHFHEFNTDENGAIFTESIYKVNDVLAGGDIPKAVRAFRYKTKCLLFSTITWANISADASARRTENQTIG